MRHYARIVYLFLIVAFSSLVSLNANAQQGKKTYDVLDSASTELTLTPGTLKAVAGKYPASMSFLIGEKNCDTSVASPTPMSFHDIASLDDTDFDIEFMAPGVSIDGTPVVTDCNISGKLKITTEQVTAGFYAVTVIRRKKGTSPAHYVGHGILTVLDASASNVAGDTSVDAYWSVLSEDMCAKNFGRQVSKDTYCIELKLGNSTGYPLQLAGIGFSRQYGTLPPDINGNLSYRSVRASLQNENSVNSRAFVLGTIEGLGLLMAGFNPFFHSAHNIARFTAGTAVVGTVLPKAISQLWPDNYQQKMNNLDDEAFRDNILIPNNTQVRMTVFMDKTLLDHSGSVYLQKVCQEFYPSGAASTPAPAEQQQQQQQQRRLEVQQKRLDDSNKQNLSDCLNAKRSYRISDPNLVKLGLGHIVIVGNLVSYMQRIVVDKGALAADQTAVKPAPLSDPTVDSTKKVVTVQLSPGSPAPVSIFLLAADGTTTYEFDKTSGPTNGSVVYTLKNGVSVPNTGIYKIVDAPASKQLLTVTGETLSIP